MKNLGRWSFAPVYIYTNNLLPIYTPLRYNSVKCITKCVISHWQWLGFLYNTPKKKMNHNLNVLNESYGRCWGGKNPLACHGLWGFGVPDDFAWNQLTFEISRDQSRVETVIQPRNSKDTFYIETVWFLHHFETNPWQYFSGQTQLIWQLRTVHHPPFYSKGAPTPAE